MQQQRKRRRALMGDVNHDVLGAVYSHPHKILSLSVYISLLSGNQVSLEREDDPEDLTTYFRSVYVVSEKTPSSLEVPQNDPAPIKVPSFNHHPHLLSIPTLSTYTHVHKTALMLRRRLQALSNFTPTYSRTCNEANRAQIDCPFSATSEQSRQFQYLHTHRLHIHIHIHTQTYTHTHTYKHIPTHTYTYKHIHIHTLIHTSTHTHTYTHIRFLGWRRRAFNGCEWNHHLLLFHTLHLSPYVHIHIPPHRFFCVNVGL